MSKNILEQPPLKQENCSTVEILRACDVKPEQISWIWNGWLAAGKFHVLGGAPGSGKTTIGIALAAIITNGGTWPDGSMSTVGNIVFWSGEDDINTSFDAGWRRLNTCLFYYWNAGRNETSFF